VSSLCLSDLFDAVAFKTLATVDLPDRGSNQHEINGDAALRAFFSTGETLSGPINWHFFADGREAESQPDGKFTFYDARANHPKRTEWRLYYSGDFLSRAEPGDTLILARPKSQASDDTLGIDAFVIQQDSNWLVAMQELFSLGESQTSFQIRLSDSLATEPIEFVESRILEEIGVDVVVESVTSDEDLVVGRFGHAFPSTSEMSAFARTLAEVDTDDADAALVGWLTREEQLFRALERVIVQQKLDEGFADVDEFISYSLSVQNRRKSRMGHAFEHHLKALFDLRGLQYSRKESTEGKNQPDFLFSGIDEYRDSSFDTDRLLMLGAKSTCKDRWRQILTEAARIPRKHLCTVQPAISEDQTDEMQVHDVQLVLPRPLFATYLATQRGYLWSVDDFVSLAAEKQHALVP